MIDNKLHLIFGAILTFIAPITGAVIGILVLVLMDMITGIWASIKKGDKIQSKKMRVTVGKFIAYFLLILTGHIFDVLFIVPFLGMTIFIKFMCFLCGTTEFYSIVENFQIILGIPDLKQKIFNFFAHINNNKKD